MNIKSEHKKDIAGGGGGRIEQGKTLDDRKFLLELARGLLVSYAAFFFRVLVIFAFSSSRLLVLLA